MSEIKTEAKQYVTKYRLSHKPETIGNNGILIDLLQNMLNIAIIHVGKTFFPVQE
jgi:hypothetical protein